MFSEEFRSKIIKVPFMNSFWFQPSSISKFRFTRFYVYIGVCNYIVLQSRMQKCDFIHINFIFHFYCNNKWFYIIYHLLFIFPRCNENMIWDREKKNTFPERQKKEGTFFRKASLRWSFTLLKSITDTSLCYV